MTVRGVREKFILLGGWFRCILRGEFLIKICIYIIYISNLILYVYINMMDSNEFATDDGQELD